ncbi:DUF1800 domain-containing protein [Roseateles sp. BYS180W]
MGLWPLRWAHAAPGNEAALLLHAHQRLSYGPRLRDLRELGAARPAGTLERLCRQQLEPLGLALPEALRQQLDALPTLSLSTAQRLHRFAQTGQVQRALRREAAAREGMSEGTAATDNAHRELVQAVQHDDARARLLRALQSPAQLQELLVEFWFNHFNVFNGKAQVRVLAGAYEREAIRPHVLGRFRDMLGATARHPAMLIYLDNVRSVAPGWIPPRGDPARQPNGLNENYARELMELHTLGVDGGYTQQDVTELARIFTGWTLDPRAVRGDSSGSAFRFDPQRHDNGRKRWLGRDIAPAGQAEGERALDVLARHSATARHLSHKLAQFFVADEPAPELVQSLAQTFLRSDGDLRALTQALIDHPAFWAPQVHNAKFKTPYRQLLSGLRLLELPLQNVDPLLNTLAQQGMPLYGSPTPDGYKYTAAAWRSPEALTQRVQLAQQLAQRAQREGLAPDGGALLQAARPLLSEATQRTLASEPAVSRLALLLASPDFMHH